MSKVLFFDIETSPNLAYVWGKYQQDVIAFAKEWEILSVSWKWQGNKEVFWANRDLVSDKKVVKLILNLFDQADLVIAHNGDKFDIKKVKARAIYHQLAPSPMLNTVDTLKVAKKHFSFTSNKLNDLAQRLGLGSKVRTLGIDTWLGCMAGKKADWKLMEKYNKKDVVLLEAVYNRLLPWIEAHPNLGLMKGTNGCNKCEGFNVTKCGFRASALGLKQRWVCKDCGGYFTTSISKKMGTK